MKKLLLTVMCVAATCITQLKAQSANVNLSNLVSPTAVNQNLFPQTNGTLDLGRDINKWRDIHYSGIVFHGGSSFISNMFGAQSLYIGGNANTTSTGTNNTALGGGAGLANTTGGNNTFIGKNAGRFNNTGGGNSFMGNSAGNNNTSGSSNTFVGSNAGELNTTGVSNTFIGRNAGLGNTTGTANTYIGTGGIATPAITGGFNTALGNSAKTSTGTINFSTALGYAATVNADHKVRLGGSSVTVVEGQVAYSFPSDGRFKINVKEDVPGLEFINKLRPVTYNFQTQKFDEFLHQNYEDFKADASLYKKSESVIQSGFIAQEVEKAAKELGYDFNGVHAPESDIDNYSMSYELLIVPVVKGMQELSKENENLKSENADLKIRLEKIEALLNISSSEKEAANFQKLVLESEGKTAVLGQNIPNPFNGKTIINYYLPQDIKSAQLVITTSNGIAINKLDITSRGQGSVEIDATKLAGGNYHYSLVVNGTIAETKQFSLVK